MTPPRALVTGANGQDGHLLIEELVTLGWDVVAVVRPGRAVGRSSGGNVVMSPVDLATRNRRAA